MSKSGRKTAFTVRFSVAVSRKVFTTHPLTFVREVKKKKCVLSSAAYLTNLGKVKKILYP